MIEPDAVSQLEYKCLNDSSFRVLSDEATVVGVQLSDSKVVAKEHIVNTSRPVVFYSAGKSMVWTLAVDQHADTLLVGENSNQQGRVVQYKLDTGDVVHDYGSLGIGLVMSSTRLGNLCFFGGYDSSSVAVVDTLTHQVVQRPVKTAVGIINSLAVCTVNPNEPDATTVLAVAGRKIDYSADRTDLFDVTQLVTNHGSPQIAVELWMPIKEHHNDLLKKVHSLEQQLQQQEQTHAAKIKAKDRELRRLESEYQALQDSLQRLKKKRTRAKNKLRYQINLIEKQHLQKVILGLVHDMPVTPDVDMIPDSISIRAPDVELDISGTED